MKKITSLIIGLMAFLFAISLNFNYALNNYGITKNTLVNAVLAQTSTTGEESGSNSGNNNSVCKVSWIAQIGGRGILLECSASCPAPQRAECKQNNCKCVV